MDEVFDSGLPAWKGSKICSARLEQLANEIAREGKVVRIERAHLLSNSPTPKPVNSADDAEKQI